MLKGVLYVFDSNSFLNLNKDILMEVVKFRMCVSLVDNRGVICFFYCVNLNGYFIIYILE